ncbi:MAG: TetR/AcrR family transcriptional regulator [Thermotogaceae bacterium]|nr:TetR/AcrR family transcriptional regulator [Thermotogaceae bacterium]
MSMLNSSRSRIEEAALNLFAKKGIEDVSIAQIVRKARVSNSTFYKYFKGKDYLVKHIFEDGIKKLNESLKVKGFTMESKLTRLIEDYVFFVEENAEMCKVLHEAEFTFAFIPKKIKSVLIKKMKEIGLIVSDELFWYVWGSVRFLTMWRYFWNMNVSESSGVCLLKFIWNGIDPDVHVLDEAVFNITISPNKAEEDTTKAKILSSAEKLFSEKGFRKTQIYDITRLAGVGLGTFYLYFETKQDVLKELVIRINRMLRHTIKAAISGISDRRDAEIAGYYAFLRFFKVHSGIYRIVREAEFILPEIAMNYYHKLHESYLPPLNASMETGQIIKYPVEDLAVFLMGIGHFMGEDLLFYTKTDEIKALKRLSKFIYKGIKGLVL